MSLTLYVSDSVAMQSIRSVIPKLLSLRPCRCFHVFIYSNSALANAY